MKGIWRDLRGGLRLFTRSPLHYSLMIATLALGAGVNVAAFSVADAMLLRPLPVERPDELIRLASSFPNGTFSYPDYLGMSRDKRIIADVAATTGQLDPAVEEGPAGRTLLHGYHVSQNYFGVLGVPLAAGRSFAPDEDRMPRGKPVMVLSHALAVERFGSASAAVGQTLRVAGSLYGVIGVAPAGFTGTIRAARVDFWAPLTAQQLILRVGNRLQNWNNHWLTFYARLAPGATLAQAGSEAETIVRRVMREGGGPGAEKIMTVRAMRDLDAQAALQPQTTTLQLGLLGLVGVVLFIACINVANLVLAKAMVRRKEIALRMAIGASRWQILRQLFVEAALLAAAGTAAGVFLAFVLIDLLDSMRLDSIPTMALDARIDGRALAVACGAAAVATICFGFAPLLDARHWDLNSLLKGALPGQPRRRSLARGGRGVLVGLQVGLAVFLLVYTGLFARALDRAFRVDPGFRTDNLVFGLVDIIPLHLPDKELPAIWQRIVDGMRALPGVREVGSSDNFPFAHQGWTNPIINGGEQHEAISRILVGPKYFAAMGIPILRGREFEPQDSAPDVDNVIVDQAMAETFWPGEDPIGKTFATSINRPKPIFVIGVAKNALYNFSTSSSRWRLRFYRLADQSPRERMAVVVHTAGDADAMKPALAAALARIEPRATMQTMTMAECMGRELLLMRVGRALLGAMALLGLVLAGIGLYGVLSFDVGRRTHEIGVRLAVGAEPAWIGRLIVQGSLPLIGIGLVLGLVTAAATSPMVRNLLMGVEPHDPASFLIAALFVALGSLAAVVAPALTAMRAKPLVALRID